MPDRRGSGTERRGTSGERRTTPNPEYEGNRRNDERRSSERRDPSADRRTADSHRRATDRPGIDYAELAKHLEVPGEENEPPDGPEGSKDGTPPKPEPDRKPQSEHWSQRPLFGRRK